nr:mannitol dehydrogenase family protein [Butyrivibrio sp.]
RYGETIKSYVAKEGDAKRLEAIPLALAGWRRYLLGVDDEGKAFERSSDPMLEELSEALKGVSLGDDAAKIHTALCPILSNANIFGSNLYEAGLGEKIEGLFGELIAGPGAVRATLKKYLD